MDQRRPVTNMATFLPSVGTVAQPRLLGDGMDSECLMTSAPSPRLSVTGRHTNLTTSDSHSSVTKSKKVRFVAHEPVRAAVKPLTTDAAKTTGLVRPLVNIPYRGIQHPNRSCVVNVVSPIGSRDGVRVPAVAQDTSVAIDVPQGSGVTSVGRYSPPDDVREVEGRSASPSELLRLQEENVKLEDQLTLQNSVNADLKKLLVASVGDDLHYKVESLIRTKATLACEIGDYTKRIYEDYETLDQLSIQADMWRSKFMANKVLIERLSDEVRRQDHRWTMAEQALRQLLEERRELSSRMIDTHRYLKLLRDSFDATLASRPPTQIADLLQLSRVNQSLADALKLRLLGTIPLLRPALDAGIENGLSPAEKLTYQVLAEAEMAARGTQSGAVHAANMDTFTRFHPNVNYDNITLQCCSRCKGDLQVV